MLSTGIMRRGALAVWDIVCWTLGTAFVIGLRYSFRITEVQWEAVLRYLVHLLAAASSVIGIATKFYRGRFLVGSFDEALGPRAPLPRGRRGHGRDDADPQPDPAPQPPGAGAAHGAGRSGRRPLVLPRAA